MKRAALVVFGGLIAVAPACSGSRDGFANDSKAPFDSDSGANADPTCPFQCSLDLRAVVRSCDGTVVETCTADRACGEGGCIDPCQAAAQARSSLGCEFLMQPPPTGPRLGRSCYAAYLVNTQLAATDLRVEYRGAPMDLEGAVFRFTPGTAELAKHTGPIGPGESVVVFLSNATKTGDEERPIECPSNARALTNDWPNPRVSGLGTSFRIATSGPVTVSTIYPFGGAASFIPSATLLLPVSGWGKQHILVTAWGRIELPDPEGFGIPGAQIVAAFDDTEVVIKPTAAIADGDGYSGTPRGTPKTFKLARGQTLQLSQAEDLTGSAIESNKPTSVFGGHACMYIPSTRGYCDAAQQEIPALEQWGSEYVVVGHRPRRHDSESSPYRIVAAFDGTELRYDPAPPAGAPRRMAAGEVATFWTTQPFIVKTQDAEHPIYMAEYMTGGGNTPGVSPPDGFDDEGDPEFVNVVPSGQYLGAYAFYADPTYPETSLVVIRHRQDERFHDVRLECAGGSIPDFRPVGTRGEFEFARVDLTRAGQRSTPVPGGSVCGHGLQQLRSDGPFTATLWGWGIASSYAYPGGMGQRKLVTRALVVR